MKTPSVGKIVLSSLIALAVSALQPLMLAGNMLVCVMPVLLCVLYAWCGWTPVVVAAAGTIGSMAAMAPLSGYGAVPGTLAAAVMLVLPGLISILMLEKGLPFFGRMQAAVGVQAACMALVMGVVYLVMKVDLVDLFTANAREAMNVMPYDMVELTLNIFANGGLLTKESIDGLNNSSLFRQTHRLLPILEPLWTQDGVITGALDQAFDSLNYQLKQTAPAMLLNSALLTGVFSTSLAGRIRARQGFGALPADRDAATADIGPAAAGTDAAPLNADAASMSANSAPVSAADPAVASAARATEKVAAEARKIYVPVRGWFLPARAVGGLAVCLLTAFLLEAANVSGGLGAASVIATLGATMFIIQGVASMSRTLRERGLGRGFRVGLIVAGLVLATQFIELLGVLSALFGRRGVVSGWIRKKIEERERDDDE